MQNAKHPATGRLPAQFREIRLELARETNHPAGSSELGYRIIAPLDQQGRIDPAIWKSHRDACRVVRFRPNEDDEVGHLVHRGHNWAFHYDIKGSDDDETGYRLADERFVPGEYVSIREEEGLRTFRVTSVEHI